MKETVLVEHDDIEDILFPVDKKKSEEFFPQTNFADNLTHCIHLPEQNKVVQMCSDTYELVSNQYLILPIYEKMLTIFGDEGFETEISSYDDRKFFVRLIIKDQLFNIIKGDDIAPVIEIHNSYDGTTKQRIALGYFRLVCSNGLMAFTDAFTTDLKHSNRVGALSLDPIFKKLEKMEMKLEQFKLLTDRQVLPEEMKHIMSKVRGSKTIKYPKKLINSAPLIAEKEAMQLSTPLNAWLVYNGFNNALYHAESKLLPDEREKIDKRVLKVIHKELSLEVV